MICGIGLHGHYGAFERGFSSDRRILGMFYTQGVGDTDKVLPDKRRPTVTVD